MGRVIVVGVSTLSVMLGCSSSSTSGSGSSNMDADAGPLGPSSPGVDVAHRLNTVIKDATDLRCANCPCGGFSPGSDVCLGAVFDYFPEAKTQGLCEIAAAERYELCVTNAVDCAAAEQCDTVFAEERTQCRPARIDAGDFVPPAGCVE